jgi:hypothetical protein
MRMLLVGLIAALSVSLAGAKPPDPVQSTFFRTRLAEFVVIAGKGLSYNLNLEVIWPFSAPVHVTVDFENPEDEASPFLVQLELPVGERSLEAHSEFFRAIRNGDRYLIKVRVYEDAAREKLMGTHEQLVEFKADRRLLKALGLRLL